MNRATMILPRNVRNGVRQCRECDGRGWHDEGMGHKQHGECRECGGDGLVPQVEVRDPLVLMGRHRNASGRRPNIYAAVCGLSATSFYERQRRQAMKHVNLPDMNNAD